MADQDIAASVDSLGLDENVAGTAWWRLINEPERLEWLMTNRGLSRSTIDEYRLGLEPAAQRYTIPIYDENHNLVNIRRYKRQDGQPKVLNTKGFGSPARLFPIDVLLDPDEVVLVESELDALVMIEHGFHAVSGTGGAATFRDEWVHHFAGKRVWIVYDCDEKGREGAAKAERQLSAVATVSVVDLGLAEGEDVTDWFVVHQRTAQELRRLLRQAPAKEPDGGVVMLSDVEQTKVEWLWRGRLPLGKLSILEGDPEGGKSLLTLDLAARITRGRDFPGGGSRPPSGVLLVCGEDDVEDTIAPRLNAAGADLTKVASLKLKRDDRGNVIPISFPEDIDRLRRGVERVCASLIIIDPITNYLSEKINSHNDASVRKALAPLGDFAQRTRCCVLLVRHLNKQGDLKAQYRGGGSIAFTGAARAVSVVGRHPEDDGVMVLARVKNNLHKAVPSLQYRVLSSENFDAPVIKWLGESHLGADELLASPDARANAPEREAAMQDLRAILSTAELPSKEVWRLMGEAGHAKNTVKRAGKRLGVHIRDQKNNETGQVESWFWSLPTETEGEG